VPGKTRVSWYSEHSLPDLDTMRTRSSIVAVIAGGAIVFAVASFMKNRLSAQDSYRLPARTTEKAAKSLTSEDQFDADLSDRLRAISSRAGGQVGVAVIHVETGRAVSVEGAKQLPLYSVFKLPLAIAVLKSVEENRLLLEKTIRVTPADVAPGSQFNLDLWRKPVERSVRELIEVSIVRSDNTSSDKLLDLIGGPAVVTQRMRQLGFTSIDIHSSTREFAARRSNPNTGSAEELARLLVQFQKGQILAAPHVEMLMGFMGRATGGAKRLRGNLPKDTPVADKTGTGEAGSNTNDVGLITLPEGKGHLAVAVLISGSKLSTWAQENIIAELARAAYDAHVALPRAPAQ
jgi:beta-lactamase class A